MKLGEVFYWTTDQAIGFAARPKYHLYVCPSDGMEDNTFLFISKADYGGDYKILKKDYGFFDLDESFVSCGSIVTYSDARVARFDPNPVGTLSDLHLRELYNAVLSSEIMEGRHIKRVCNALKCKL
jgi:hypothetical protein